MPSVVPAKRTRFGSRKSRNALKTANDPDQVAILLAEETAEIYAAADSPAFRSDWIRQLRSTRNAERRNSPAGTNSFPAPRAATLSVTALSTMSSAGCRRSGRWASTSFISRRSIRSARPTEKAATTRSKPDPDDPGSPYAIGSAEGGHDAIHPELGTLEDFRALLAGRAAARPGDRARFRHSMLARSSLAQAASRMVLSGGPTGRSATRRTRRRNTRTSSISISTRKARSLRSGSRCATSILFWIDQGVRIFRVDNPHTKPLPFWEWMIADIRARPSRRRSFSPRRSPARR